MNDSSFLANLTCTNSQLRKNFSELCLMYSDQSPEECFPSDFDLMFAEGVWVVVNALVGFIGNLLIIVSIPFAAHRNK